MLKLKFSDGKGSQQKISLGEFDWEILTRKVVGDLSEKPMRLTV